MTKCDISTGHRAGRIEVALTVTSDATISIIDLPAGSVLQFLTRRRIPIDNPLPPTSVDGDTSHWYLTATEVDDLADGGATYVDIRHDDTLLLTGRVGFFRAGHCPSPRAVTYVTGPRGPEGPAGTAAVSADPGNAAVLGTDDLVYVPEPVGFMEEAIYDPAGKRDNAFQMENMTGVLDGGIFT